MRWKFLIVLIIFLSGGVNGDVEKIDSKPELDGPFLVVKVIDGDTIDLENGERIRFSGINTPETGECYYQEARDTLKKMLLNRYVYLEKDRSDRGNYGRLLRYVYLEGTNVNSFMVMEGYAKVYDKYKDDTKRYGELKIAENIAIERGLGVWGCVDLKEGCLYVGSKNSEKYHTPACKYAKKIKEENLVCYESEEDVVGLEFSGC